MKIELKKITVAELVGGYDNKGDDGVVGYGGRLDIRPPYQREFIYNAAQSKAVIDTLHRGFPLNVMYWAVRGDGDFEIIDGQQRTISICEYVAGKFSCEGLFGIAQSRAFQNLQNDEQEKINNYELMVYLCTGSDSEKLQWFRTINIAGVKLRDQELRNAVYSGTWVTAAKRHFSKINSPAKGVGGKYLSGEVSRQDYLESAIKWLAGGTANIETYMGKHQNDKDAEELWAHFCAVIEWVKKVFPKHRKEMKSVDWGAFYAAHKNAKLNPKKLEEKIAALMQDDDVTKKSGAYPYVLTGDERHLNIRAFTPAQKRSAYERQKGKCRKCKKEFGIDEMQGDHIKPWSKGGKTVPENCQMLCHECHRQKGAV